MMKMRKYSPESKRRGDRFVGLELGSMHVH